MNKPIIEKLKFIGLKEYEAKILLVLLKGMPMSASEIAKEAKLIRNSIYDTLKSFAEKGFCNEIETNTIHKYQIIDPKVIADKIERDYETSNHERINALKSTFSEIEKVYKENKTDVGQRDMVELIRGFNKHRVEKYTRLIHAAKSEILTMNRLRGLVSPELDTFTKRFVKKGGKVRSIYKYGLDFKVIKEGKAVDAKPEDLVMVCRRFESIGEKVRISDKNIPNLVIVDREKTFVHITGKGISAKNQQTDLIVHDRDYTGNMIDFFNFYWEKSLSIEEFSKKKK